MKSKLGISLDSVALAAVLSVSTVSFAASYDMVTIVGSSTVYPFATVVAERFGRSTTYKSPKVESTGTGGGFKLFCSGVGASTPSVTNASRRIKKSEYDDCQANGVETIIEVPVGYDGIAIANSTNSVELSLTLRDLYLALAKDVPGPDGKLIANPYRTWKDVNSELPNVKIEVLGPPPTSGTRDAFVELAMAGGAKSDPTMEKLYGLGADEADEIKIAMLRLGISDEVYDALASNNGRAPKGKDVFTMIAYALREDGVYVEAGENDNLIVQKLEANPTAVGIFGYSFLEENGDKVRGSTIDGVRPSFDTVASGDYPVSRPLYFYLKGAHVGKIRGLQEYALEFTSNKAMGEDGYLPDRGLIPLSDSEREAVQADINNLKRLEM